MRAFTLAAALVLAGCASAPSPHPINLPNAAASQAPTGEDLDISGDRLDNLTHGGAGRTNECNFKPMPAPTPETLRRERGEAFVGSSDGAEW